MSEIIRERSPRSRGRVRCDDCGRRIPKGERYSRLTLVDGGTIWDWRECQPCETAASHVMRWRGPYGDDYYPDDFHEWAHEAMDGCYYTPYGLFCDDGTPDGWEWRLRALSDEATKAAEADADPARSWDDEAWAAFTWRMQTSPVFNTRRK
jgi:hypothetical protein